MASKTPEDFWQLAASHDKTARKWRVGDAAKGARGFLRAIEVYTTGLQQHPANFELAYNRKFMDQSRLLLELLMDSTPWEVSF
ncbi:MAG: hypothetical protein Q9157_002577 [Trypethelium eluteriae]